MSVVALTLSVYRLATGDVVTTLQELAARDQAEAEQRETIRKVQRFDRITQRVATWLLALFAMAGTYALMAVLGVLPAAPWSALGQSNGYDVDKPLPPAEIHIPEGYEPGYEQPQPQPVAPAPAEDQPLLSA